MKYLISFITITAIFCCTAPETDSDICIDDMLERLDMEPYSGVIESECRNYLAWATYDGNDYFMWDNPCADIALHLWDCDKIDLCQDSTMNCQQIIADMTRQGIVGRSK